MKRPLALIALALSLAATPALAGEQSAARTADAYAAAKSADIEALRLRMGPGPSATYIEAQEALRRYRLAPADRKTEAQAVLDAAVTRLELETRR